MRSLALLSILALLALSTPVLAADATGCEVRLLPPATIKKFAVNFIKRTIDVLGKSGELEDAVEATRELLERAGDGDFEVKLVEGRRKNFDLSLGYPAGLDGIRPVIRSFEISPRAANALFRDTRGPVQPSLVREWLSALAEVYLELEYEKGRGRLEDVNLFTVLELKTRWLDAFARVADGDPVDPPSDDEAAQAFWPVVSKALKANDLRKIVSWLAIGHFNRVGGDPAALDAAIKTPIKLQGTLRERYLELGLAAANLFAARSMLELGDAVAVFETTPEKVKAIEAVAKLRFEAVTRSLARELSRGAR